MKKKFLISGAAVFLVVCLLTSALFAFADVSDGCYSYSLDSNNIITSISSLGAPSSVISTSKGGTFTDYSGNLIIFPSFLNVFFATTSTRVLLYFESLPSVGDTLVRNTIELSGTPVGDTVDGQPIYKFDLPNDYPYYGNNHLRFYTPPLFVRVNSTISGIFTSAGEFLNGVLSVPILAILVIGVPVISLIIAITLSLTVGRKRNKSYKKSRRRR